MRDDSGYSVFRIAPKCVRFKVIALSSALLIALSGCTAALTPPEPAAPKDAPAASQSPEDDATAPIRLGSNPYDAGAERAWSVELSSPPSFVGYDKDTKMLIVAEDGIGRLRHARISAYSVTEEGTLLSWSTDLAGVRSVTAMALSGDAVYVNTLDNSGRVDFVSLDSEKGKVFTRWSYANQLDSDVPQIVTAAPQGVGVIKYGSTRITAAILNSAGEALDTYDVLMRGSSIDTPRDAYGKSIVELGEGAALSSAFEAEEFPAQDSLVVTEKLIYPSLAVIADGECYGASDGVVCVKEAASSQEESASSLKKAASRKIEVTEYDLAGHSMRVSIADERSAAAQLSLVSVNSDATARQISDALLMDYPAEQEDRGEDSNTDRGENGNEDSNADANEDDDAGLSEQTKTRLAAILYDGEWIEQKQWAQPDKLNVADAAALAGQAPLYQLSSGEIISARSGKQITAEGAIGYVGLGQSASMLFEYSEGVLYYLEPLGDSSTMGDSARIGDSLAARSAQ